MKYFLYGDHNGFSLEKVTSWSFYKTNNQEILDVHLIEGENVILSGTDVTRFFDAIRGE
jgi:hypothetical protein